MVGRTKSRTKADEDRFHAIKYMGCLPCHIEGRPGVPADVHHVLSGGRRIGHQASCGLCVWHHGRIVPGRGSIDDAKILHGPNLKDHKREFEGRYGTEDELVQITDALVREHARAQRYGSYLTDSAISELVWELYREIVHGMPPSAGAS